MRIAKSPKVIRKYVTALLMESGINEPPIPVEMIAKSLGATVRYSPFLQGDLAGMLIRADGHAVIGVNSLDHPNRQRFTIAHECGHLLLHKGKKAVYIDRDFRINRRDGVSSLAVNSDEIEANRFAAELLIPYSMITADLTQSSIDIENEVEFKRLARRYQVSVQAMTHRITNLLGF